MRLYSFDVFDTLIIRKVATPRGIFVMMQEELNKPEYEDIPACFREDFYSIRIGAESVARKTYCSAIVQDVTLTQIYGILVESNNITPSQAQRLCDLECLTEIRYSDPIVWNIEFVKKLIMRGERVVLISDMYLDVSTIRAILCKFDDVFEHIKIYVSSEAPQKNKYSGDLFEYIKETEKIDFSEWIHYGDNKHSDFEVPISKGIHCELVENAQLEVAEKAYLKNHESDVTTQLVMGRARKLRHVLSNRNYILETGCNLEKQKLVIDNTEAYTYGVTFGGPILYPYADWIIQRCQQENIKRLYFVARDGFIIKQIVDEILKRRNLLIETRLIFGSRMAWRIPRNEYFCEDILEIYNHSFQDRISNMRDLATFFQMDCKELEKYETLIQSACGELEMNWWNKEQVDVIIHCLLKTEAFVCELKKIYDSKRILLQQYIKQEADMSDENYAFVDVAGSGLTMEYLARNILSDSHKMKCFYYRMDKCISEKCENYVFYPFYVDYFVILEMLCRAPLEQTEGYSMDSTGKIVPVFKYVDKKAIEEHGIYEFINGVVEYAKDAIEDEFHNPNRRLIGYYLEFIKKRPDEGTLSYFAEMPNMLTGREENVCRFAPKLSSEEIRKIYWYHQSEDLEKCYQGADFPYSLLRCTPIERQRIQEYEWFRRNFGTLKGKIAIYGAGKKGRVLYSQIQADCEKGIVDKTYLEIIWVDKRAEECRAEGLNVYSIESLIEYKADCVLVAIADLNIFAEIKKELINLGVKGDKIIRFLPI